MGKRPIQWGYGVTTVPSRRTTLLRRTLRSLANAGFSCPRLFVDDCSFPEDFREFNLLGTYRDSKVGVAGNWILSAMELYYRQPGVDRYAIFQDDMVTCRNLRAYLDKCEYPHQGYWNLCTYPTNLVLSGGKKGWNYSDQMGRGAQGLVFDNETLRSLLQQEALTERARRGRLGTRSVDGTISIAMKHLKYKEYVHNPSLLFHTGEVTSQRGNPQPTIEGFPGEDYDALQFLEGRNEK